METVEAHVNLGVDPRRGDQVFFKYFYEDDLKSSNSFHVCLAHSLLLFFNSKNNYGLFYF